MKICINTLPVQKLALILGAAILFSDASANAAKSERSIEIVVETVDTPKSSVGLIMSPTGTKQRLDVTPKQLRPGVWVVNVPYSEKEIADDTTATAILVSEAGNMTFGQVRSIQPRESGAAFVSIPDCVEESTGGSAAVGGQFALIQSLVDVRAARRAYAHKKVGLILSKDFLERLRKLEKGFGMARTSELGPDLPPTEVIDRLSRLINAVKIYNSRKEAAVAASKPEAASASAFPAPTVETKEVKTSSTN